MANAVEVIDDAIHEVSRARSLLARIRSQQIRGTDELAMLRTIAYAWFQNNRGVVLANLGTADLSEIDNAYQTVLDATEKSAARTTYLDALRRAKSSLISLRSVALTAPPPGMTTGDDLAPDFSPLVGSEQMRVILTRRWDECRRCVAAEAHLAAIVMMGGLLEALFVARANIVPNKESLIKAKAAPKDSKTGKTANYQDWMLDSYIKVGHELEWITDSAKQIADVLKEFRNYVHPAKELRHGVNLADSDFIMFWNVTKALVRQLLHSAARP
jgi:hypothetical protein